jgi:hypothetical protein
MTALLALLTYQAPAAGIPKFSWQRWLTRKVPLAAAFILVMHLQYVAVPTIPESPMARPLAEHLTTIGAKFYGASWCEHCKQQKKYFGESAERLPYVECTPGGQGGPLSSQCRDNFISTYPTWIIKERRVEGVLSLTDLAELSGFQIPQTGTN